MKKYSSKPEQKIHIAPDADVVGDVTIGEGSSVWYHAVIRGDDAPVTIGRTTNIQDGCIIHTDEGYPAAIGDRVTVGHGAIIHGCKIGSDTLIGMGSIILNGAKIGDHCLIGAGALVPEHAVIPDGSLAFGSPAKVKRDLTEEEKTALTASAEKYIDLAEQHFGE